MISECPNAGRIIVRGKPLASTPGSKYAAIVLFHLFTQIIHGRQLTNHFTNLESFTLW